MSTPTYAFDVEFTLDGRKYAGTTEGDLSCAGCGKVTVDDLVVLPPMFSEVATNDIRLFIPSMHRECLGVYLSKLFRVDAP